MLSHFKIELFIPFSSSDMGKKHVVGKRSVYKHLVSNHHVTCCKYIGIEKTTLGREAGVGLVWSWTCGVSATFG
jgi:hypothetical protein